MQIKWILLSIIEAIRINNYVLNATNLAITQMFARINKTKHYNKNSLPLIILYRIIIINQKELWFASNAKNLVYKNKLKQVN